MPVRTKVNRSAEIRKIYAEGTHSAAEIVAKLKARGITIKPALVYNVLSSKKNSKRKTRAPLSTPTSPSKADVVDHAVVFVRSAGGMQNARELLSKLAMLHN